MLQQTRDHSLIGEDSKPVEPRKALAYPVLALYGNTKQDCTRKKCG